MLETITSGQLEEILAGGLIGAAGVFLALKRIALRAAVDDTKLTGMTAAKAVIELLRTEVERLSTINTRLATEINSLKFENLKLNTKITELSIALDEMKTKLEIIAIRGRKGDRVNDEERRVKNNHPAH